MKKLGKQAVSILAAALVMVLFIVPIASGEQGAWDCPECGRTGNLWNYCGNCAHPAPWTTAAPAAEAAASAPSSSSGTAGNELGEISSLDINERAVGTVYHFTYQVSAAANPSTGSGHGYLYVNADSANYGIQIAYSDQGIFTRTLNNGTYGAWTNTATSAASAAPAASASSSIVIELGTISSLDITEKEKGAIYHFVYESKSGSPSNGMGQGFLFVNSDDTNYGRQIFFSDGGIYTRRLDHGVYRSWKAMSY